jgi:hypothetical protein
MAGDPRNDPRAHDLLGADPGVVSSLVGMFRTVAMQAQSTADGLHGAASDATWTGSAASAFRQGVGQLPADLNKVTSSYQEAAGALAAYEGELSSLKPAFQSIVSQLGSADGALANAKSSLSNAQSELNTAQSKLTATAMTHPLAANPLPAVPLSSPLHTAVNAASSAVGNAQGEISALSARGFSILDEFESARNAAEGRVSSASHIPPHRSFWDSVFHDIGNGLSAFGHFVAGIGVGIWNSVTGTVGAFEDFVNDPTLANFGKLASDVAVDASIVLLAAAAPEALGLVGAAEVAGEGAAEEGVTLAARLATLGKGADGVAKGAVGLKALTDLGQGHYAQAGIDGVFIALPGGDSLANAAHVGDAAAEEAVSASEAVQTYKFFADHGVPPDLALALMSDGEVDAVLPRVSDLSSKADIGAAARSTAAQAVKAARVAATVGRPVAFAADSVKDKVQEITTSRVDQLLHPEPSTCP